MGWSRQDERFSQKSFSWLSPQAQADAAFMARCLELAKRGEGKVSPNPVVGAVIVKNGKIIGEGWHERFGGPHAEANAIADAARRGGTGRIAGSTLYVSLEPCSHSGGGKKTPPCVPLIIKNGIARVVIGAPDRNPRVRGMEQLEAAGIRVEAGLLLREAAEQNEAFFKFIATGRPFVVVKMAQSADGKIGVKGRGIVRISGSRFDAVAQRMRNRYDAILVGINTVLEDDPLLTCRMRGGRNPARIILDSSLRIPLGARVLRNARKEKVIVATSQEHDAKKRQALEKKGVKVLVCGKRKASLPKLLRVLPSLGIYSVLIEGGAQVDSSALRERLVDRLVVCISPRKMGNADAVASPITLEVLRALKGKRKYRLGKDAVIEGLTLQLDSDFVLEIIVPRIFQLHHLRNRELLEMPAEGAHGIAVRRDGHVHPVLLHVGEQVAHKGAHPLFHHLYALAAQRRVVVAPAYPVQLPGGVRALVNPVAHALQLPVAALNHPVVREFSPAFGMELQHRAQGVARAGKRCLESNVYLLALQLSCDYSCLFPAERREARLSFHPVNRFSLLK